MQAERKVSKLHASIISITHSVLYYWWTQVLRPRPTKLNVERENVARGLRDRIVRAAVNYITHNIHNVSVYLRQIITRSIKRKGSVDWPFSFPITFAYVYDVTRDKITCSITCPIYICIYVTDDVRESDV